MSVTPAGDLEFRDLPGRRTADPLAGVETRSSLRIVRLARTPGRTAHRHPHSEEIVYVVRGNGAVWLAGEWLPVGPGDVVRVPPDTPHATVPREGEEMELVCFFPHPDLADNLRETDIVVDE